jgi:hypothetical protein
VSARRAAVARALWQNMNCWMGEFAQSISAISRGLADGRLTEEIIRKYPEDHSYPEQLSRAIAHQVGLHFSDDPDVWVHGWRQNVDAEAIGIAIEALVAIADDETVNCEGMGGTWSFYQDTLNEAGVSIADIQAEFAECTDLVAAARLIVAANEARP